MNCDLNSDPVFANLPIKKLSKTQCNRVSLQFTDRVFGIQAHFHGGVRGSPKTGLCLHWRFLHLNHDKIYRVVKLTFIS